MRHEKPRESVLSARRARPDPIESYAKSVLIRENEAWNQYADVRDMWGYCRAHGTQIQQALPIPKPQ